MQSLALEKLLSSATHHAYLVIGDSAKNFENLRHFFVKKISAGEIEVADFWSRSYETVSIDDAREIKEVQNTRPIGDKRTMLLSLRTIQSEAQNSLLKLFEDPSSKTVFIVCADSPSSFLPTLLSRFYIFQEIKEKKEKKASDSADDYSADLAAKFLSGTVQERMSLLEPLIKEKDKTGAEKFLNELEAKIYADGLFKERPKERAFIFENIFSARRFLQSRSPSLKMILENLCGIVPIV